MYRIFLCAALAAIGFVPVASGSALAACATPVGDKPEGSIIYNLDHKTPQYCDGTQWVGMGTKVQDTVNQLSCDTGQTIKYDGEAWACAEDGAGEGDDLGDHTATQNIDLGGHSISSLANPMNPQDGATKAYVDARIPLCPAGAALYSDGTALICSSDLPACEVGAVGTACPDGAIYAGQVGVTRIYVAPADQSQAYQLKSTNTATPGTTSTTDGLANTNAMVTAGAASHPAAQSCRSKGADWYLPAKAELNTLYYNRGLLGSANLAGASFYWSSSEFSPAFYGWLQDFSDGLQTNSTKDNFHRVRCVRR